MENAKEYYNKRALKNHIKRAVKKDHGYFNDMIIELMEGYHQSRLKEKECEHEWVKCKPYEVVSCCSKCQVYRSES